MKTLSNITAGTLAGLAALIFIPPAQAFENPKDTINVSFLPPGGELKGFINYKKQLNEGVSETANDPCKGQYCLVYATTSEDIYIKQGGDGLSCASDIGALMTVRGIAEGMTGQTVTPVVIMTQTGKDDFAQSLKKRDELTLLTGDRETTVGVTKQVLETLYTMKGGQITFHDRNLTLMYDGKPLAQYLVNGTVDQEVADHIVTTINNHEAQRHASCSSGLSSTLGLSPKCE